MAHSSNVFIHESTFNSAQGDIHINNKDSGLHILRLGLGASIGAIHDSAQRYPPPNCHPETRMAVRRIILDWIHSEICACSFLWLYGPAGAGKTAILQTIAELLCCPGTGSPSESGQFFGGSFFFRRGNKGCDQGHFLFSTIAYQLALNVPGLRQYVNRIMESNPILHTKSMVLQLQTLIVDAFRNLSPLPQRSYLVIIDGLDECHDKATQQTILRLLCETITVHKLPLRFLIGSRPESHIRASFDQKFLYTITRRVVLDETFNPKRDIRVFLQDGFAKICAENPILSHVEQPWPEEGIIDLLVERSSGQFIYAATVLKFVGADFCSPTKQLELVLKRKPNSAAFSDLDQLYMQILSVYPSTVNIVQILGFILTSSNLAEVIEVILGMEEGQLKLVLRGLSSLMEDENVECLNMGANYHVIPSFAHASFRDYLFDSSRSGRFHVNHREYYNQVTIRGFALIMQLIRSWRTQMSSITRVLHTTTWDYFHDCLPFHFSSAPEVVKQAIMRDVNDLMQEFWRLSSDGVVGASFHAMYHLRAILQDISDSELDVQLRAEFRTLLDGYQKMLDRSFSISKDLDDMFRFLQILPGVVVQQHMTIQEMADLYRIKPDLLEHFIRSIRPLRPCSFEYLCGVGLRYMLDDYLSGFFQDRGHSQLYYCDPMLQHISICRHFLSLLNGSNAVDLQSSRDLSDYVFSHFYDHLCAATKGFLCAQNISDDHPAVEILHDLEAIAYNVDKDLSGFILKLPQCIIQAILRWANMLNRRLKGVAVSVSNVDLMERVCHLTNKIYREMLCITRHGRISSITIHGLDPVPVGVSCPPQYRVVLSWDLLAWISVEGRIPCSFTNFITTPELSGPFKLYIRPDIYHTQITEYSLASLQTIYQDLVLSDRATCTITSRVNFFDTELSVDVDLTESTL